MAIGYSPADFERMMFLKGEIEKAIIPYRDNTEAALAVFALVLSAKTLLQLYPRQTREELQTVIAEFLEGKAGGDSFGLDKLFIN